MHCIVCFQSKDWLACDSILDSPSFSFLCLRRSVSRFGRLCSCRLLEYPPRERVSGMHFAASSKDSTASGKPECLH